MPRRAFLHDFRAGEHGPAGLVAERRLAAADKHRRPGGSAFAGFAARRHGQKTPRIHGVKGNIGAVGGVCGRLKLRTVFFSGLSDAAGKLNDGFSSRNIAEQAGKRFERGKLAVRVENVELGFVGRECGSRILAGCFLAWLRGGFAPYRPTARLFPDEGS